MNRYRPFNEAREYARKLGLPNKRGWHQYCNSNKKPPDIPSHPERIYKGWTTSPDFLGTGNVAGHKKEYLSFDAAREYIRKQKIPGKEAWQQYCASGNKPDNIPSRPKLKYKGEGWTDWYDFLGTQPKFLSFTETREYVRKIGIQDTKAWNQHLKSGNKPDNIPAHPDRVYKGEGWTDWYDFLGTRLSFAQAREIISS